MRFLDKLNSIFNSTFMFEWMALTLLLIGCLVIPFGLECLAQAILPAFVLTFVEMKWIDWLLKD